MRRRIAMGAVVAGVAGLLVACSNENGQNSLDPKGPEAQRIDDLFLPIVGIAIVIGIFVVAATVVLAIRFRHREGKPDNPRQIHGSTPLEIGWTIVPALILAVIAVPTVSTIFKLAEDPSGPEVLRVNVVGKQWWWEFEYPRQDLVDRKVVTSTEMYIPAGIPIELVQTSDNVIHSFWIPELNGKKDVVPGRENRNKFTAPEPGTYLGQCAEYCGLAHADMRMRVVALERSEWEDWLAGQQEGPAQPWTGEIQELTATKYACTNCHVFDDSTQAPYGPNLTHLASRQTFAGGVYELNRENLIDWILDAPSMIPMESKDCRLPPPATCVGMPSFVKDTPKGQPVMTRQDAETIADYLLEEK